MMYFTIYSEKIASRSQVLEARPGEVATSEIAYLGVNGIGAGEQVELGVQGDAVETA